MKNLISPFLILSFVIVSCSSGKNLVYLNNLAETGGKEVFPMSIPEYKIQYRDILYITVKAMIADGTITDFLSPTARAGSNYTQSEAGQYLYGYDVNSTGEIVIPVLGRISVAGTTLEEARIKIQGEADKVYKNSTVECKLLSYKYTVIGEVKVPGTYINYNNYLTVLEAIGRAGGIGDYGKRDKILVVRSGQKETQTFRLSLQDKDIIRSEAYFIQPNDVIIVDPQPHKIFNLNLPTFAFVLTTITSTITTTLLLIDYFNK